MNQIIPLLLEPVSCDVWPFVGRVVELIFQVLTASAAAFLSFGEQEHQKSSFLSAMPEHEWGEASF